MIMIYDDGLILYIYHMRNFKLRNVFLNKFLYLGNNNDILIGNLYLNVHFA